MAASAGRTRSLRISQPPRRLSYDAEFHRFDTKAAEQRRIIYPQECENLLITHPMVADAAVFGVPNEDLGEEVKAVVQAMPGVATDSNLVDELIAFCTKHLSRQKCPRSIDFEAELPRLPTGKLYKRLLRDRYWADRKSRIV